MLFFSQFLSFSLNFCYTAVLLFFYRLDLRPELCSCRRFILTAVSESFDEKLNESLSFTSQSHLASPVTLVLTKWSPDHTAKWGDVSIIPAWGCFSFSYQVSILMMAVIYYYVTKWKREMFLFPEEQLKSSALDFSTRCRVTLILNTSTDSFFWMFHRKAE